ncbi:efflux RND transporter periplasmic adaptor subunit [Mesorhizobium sp. BR1-1-16]|uniref:efflux RND transporter periplasmic adaptor subunit n=1 Tax=Mesorhizobium sp. BR1-1-16 TaxID=2876653 RepID=UPI001CCA9697|nr:efflux RND transporter periplasmic adaptor subunit [Mesorhizobium sp. BR1-1-16]MBZ9935800.1 efflux RND transporter periplasmic adaptor subunit [Mesorhizobium sp. BR1-1-16]
MMKQMPDDDTSAGAGQSEPKPARSLVESPRLADIIGPAARPHRWRRWGLLALIVVALAAAYLLWPIIAGGGDGITYTTAPATRGSLTVTVTATGSVQPTEEVDVSSELSGRIKSVNVDYNSPVKAGDVLAELVTDNLDAALASARAKLAAAKANVAKAHATIASTESTLESKKVLVGRNVSSSQELIEAQANYDAAVASEAAANAEVDVATADLSLAETNLSKAVIRSPIDGIVLTRSVDPGATVAASLSAPTLFVIAGDLRQMELQVDVDEADVGETAIGQKATFSVDAYPDQSFPAAIKDIRFVSETTNNVVTYKALLTVDNEKLLLRPGMTATADIVVEEVKDATLIPNAALRYVPPATTSSPRAFGLFRAPNMGAITTAEPTGHDRRVYVLRDDVPTPVSIEIGATDGVHTVVKSGDIKEGDSLIVDATARK